MSYDIKIYNPSGDFSEGNHDIYFDTLGSTVQLFGQDKLIQDVLKIFFTEVNHFYSQYGTNLNGIIGTNLGIQGTINTLSQYITDALVYLQSLQQEQQTYQQVLASEIIENILTLNVNYLYDITNNENDVRTFSIQVVLKTADGQTVIVTKDVTAV